MADKNDDSINEQDELIDINRLLIRVLIVCTDPTAMGNVTHYLGRRGWDAVVVASVKEAFQLIGKFNPDFILLSVNLKTANLERISVPA